jgi:hypothetical protein
MYFVEKEPYWCYQINIVNFFMKDSLRTSIDESFAILDNKLSILPKWYEV